jgi:hypothetical protein
MNCTNLHCYYTNADQLKNKFEEFKLTVIQEDPDIIAITEVKPKNCRYRVTEANYTIPNYKLWQKNIDNNCGKGIIMYTKNGIPCQEVVIDDKFSEQLWMEIPINIQDKILIGCIYRSNSGTRDNNDNLLRSISTAAEQNYRHTIIVGDFNYPKIDWDTWSTTGNESSDEHKFIECLRDNYLYQSVSKPTRTRGHNKPSLLDVVISTSDTTINSVEHRSPLGASDHCGLNIDINACALTPSYKKTKYYYNKGNYRELQLKLDTQDWNRTFETHKDDVQEQWNIMDNILKDLMDTHIPKRDINSNQHQKWDMPCDLHTRKLIHRNHRMWTRYMETGDQEKFKEYCKIRNKVRAITRTHRKSYEKNFACQSKVNPKHIWKYINSRTKTRKDIADLY